MTSIVFLLLVCLLVLVFLILRQKKEVKLLNEALENIKTSQEIQEIKANLKGRDQERIRIAKDWHDGIGNYLSTLRLLIDTIQPKNPKRQEEVVNLLEDTQKEFRQIIDNEIVNCFFDKESVIAIFKKWQRQLQIGNIILEFKVYCFLAYEEQSEVFKNHLYRILQELLHNVIKHSGASVVQIELKEEDGVIQLSVRDNGRGIAMDNKNEDLLRSVKSRVKVLNGNINIQTENNKGTIIIISIPTYPILKG